MSERFQIGRYWLSKRRGSENWHRTWFDRNARQTKRASLGTDDIETAKQALAEWVTINSQIRNADPSDVPISTIFARYYANYGKTLASHDQTRRALNMWIDYYQDKTVSELTTPEQEGFIGSLASSGYSNGYIRRIITAGKAALHYAYRRQEIASVPFIMTVPEEEAGHEILTLRETAALFNACKPGDKDFMYLMLAYNTLGRPKAILDITPAQVDLQARIINLLPPGQKQNKKRRPKLPISNTLLPWLQWCDGESFVNYRGRQINNNKKSFVAMCERAHVKATRYTIRHTMATWMRSCRVSNWEVEGWLGHRLPSTSERYAAFAPDYLSDGREAIDKYFDKLQKLVSYPLRLNIHTKKMDAC